MPFAGCQNDAQISSVLNCARTPSLIDDIDSLVSTDVLHIDASKLVIHQLQHLDKLKAIFFEIHTQEVSHDSIDLVKQIRKINRKIYIFIFATLNKSFSGTDFYLAGADYCVKLPSDQKDKQQLLSQVIKKSYWNSPTELYLDRTRLLLCNADRKLEISYTEMIIIDALVNAPEHVMSQDNIAKTLDPNIIFYDPRALEKTISRLRMKIKNAYNLELIISVRTYGYRLRRGTISD